MAPPPSPMDVDIPSKGKKRTAENFSPIAGSPGNTRNNDSNTPRILRRHHHRRRNIAASIWGPDIAPTPASFFNLPARARHQPFNIYKALIRHPNLFFQFALRLPYPAFLHLFAIDKEFHFRVNQYSVSLIHDYAKYHAPLAGYIFSWVLFPALCISDPMLRPMDQREWLARDAPGFRWVGMVLRRERVVRCILTRLGLEGHRVPEGVMPALMKFWSVLEMRTSLVRRAFLQDREIWADEDFFHVLFFLVKLDMRFAHPIMGNGAGELSRLLLTQHSLVPLCKVLTGEKILDYDNVTDMLVRTYNRSAFDFDAVPWLEDEEDNGVPAAESGLLCREEWDTHGAPMPPLIDLLVTEGLRRGLRFYEHYLDFALYGYVDGETGWNLPMPRKVRGDKGVTVLKRGRPVSEEWMLGKMKQRFLRVFADEIEMSE